MMNERETLIASGIAEWKDAQADGEWMNQKASASANRVLGDAGARLLSETERKAIDEKTKGLLC